MAKTTALVAEPTTGLDRLKTGPARLGEFLKDVRAEMKKVITPSRDEVKNTTIVVIVTVVHLCRIFCHCGRNCRQCHYVCLQSSS